MNQSSINFFKQGKENGTGRDRSLIRGWPIISPE